MCDVLNEVSAPDSDSSSSPSVYHILKCLDSILAAPVLPPSLHKYDIVVRPNATRYTSFSAIFAIIYFN